MLLIILSMLVVLAAVATLFLFYPVLYGARGPIKLARNQDRVGAYESRNQELDDELEKQLISESDHRSLKQELDRQLLLDTETAEKTVEARGQLNWRWSLMTLAAMVIVAGLLYWPLGQQQAYTVYQLAQVQDRSPQHHERYVEALEAHVANQSSPEIEDLFALAEIYGDQERFPEAIDILQQVEAAFREFDEYDPDDLSTVVSNRAQYRFLHNDRTLNEAVEADFAEALRLDPLNTQALATLGVAYMDAGDYDRAIEVWERFLDVSPQGGMSDAVAGALEQARRLRGDNVDAAVDSVQVLFSALPDDVDEDAFVYVVARPVDGELPVAIQRYRAEDLPLALRLTDQDRSADMAPLSGEPRVEVLAFITPPGASDLSTATHRTTVMEAPTQGDDAVVTLVFEPVP